MGENMTIVHIIAALGGIAALCTYTIFKASGAGAAGIYLVYTVAVCVTLTLFLVANYT